MDAEDRVKMRHHCKQPSTIVTDGELPQEVKQSLSAWAGCVAGAWDVKDYVAAIEAAGFTDVEVKATYWDEEMVEEAIAELGQDTATQLGSINGQDSAEFDPGKAVFSARVTAVKPD